MSISLKDIVFKRSFLILASGVIALGVAVFLSQGHKSAENEAQATENAAVSAPVDQSSFDFADILEEKVLGDKTAPIKISEHSSLTCGHCGNFHKTAFKDLKEQYIDTGKAYLVFSDFPLNGPAVHASLAARCADDGKYFDFIQALFETQDQWAYDVINYRKKLKSMAADYGLDGDRFGACIDDKSLQKGLLDLRESASKAFGIDSTPSFVINDTTRVSAAALMDALSELTKEATTE